MTIDPNIYIGAAIFALGTLIGYVMGIARPYLDKRLLARSQANNAATKQPIQGNQPQGTPALKQAQQPAGGA